jgi:hypothetical protein
VLFIDRCSDPAWSTLIVSIPRSGSTALAEALVRGRRLRLLFEPLTFQGVPYSRSIPPGYFVPPLVGNHLVDEAIDSLVAGRLRCWRHDRFNRSRWPRGRVIKDFITNLAPRIAYRHPEAPLIYLIRHPIASAVSRRDLGWQANIGRYGLQNCLIKGPLAPWQDLIEENASADPKEVSSHVFRWCLENIVPIRLLHKGAAHVIFYENLMRDPETELSGITAYLSSRCPDLWAAAGPSRSDFEPPSRTSWLDARASHMTPELRAFDWKDRVEDREIESCREILKAFELDFLYRDSLVPQVAADAFLQGERFGSFPC